MTVSTWIKSLARLGPKTKKKAKAKTDRKQRLGAAETVTFSVTQNGNSVAVESDPLSIHFAVEGIDLPKGVDASFAVWGILAAAMDGGFNVHFKNPIDPVVAANAETFARIWEMWVPSLYRSIKISSEGEWSRNPNRRLPRVDLYSGGVDSTFFLLETPKLESNAYALTVEGLDYRKKNRSAHRFPELLAKTKPFLEKLNYEQIVIRTDASRYPMTLTHGLTLASCLFLLSDLFEAGGLAADRTEAQDMLTFPWGTNHITNAYLAGSDFAVHTMCAGLGRTEKLAVIAEHEFALRYLSFCREPEFVPSNCGRCDKCIRTKMMFAATLGRVPEIFIDNHFDEEVAKRLVLTGRERAHVLDMHRYATKHGRAESVPGLLDLVEKCRGIEIRGESESEF